MSQKIKEVALKDLVLWTENPRDPIGGKADNQAIADHAIADNGRHKWDIKKLCDSMEKQSSKILHSNELPTVVEIKDGKFNVYDGNRRVLIGMLMHGHVKADGWQNPKNFKFPTKINCNICDKETALDIVDRMHADNGTWKPLEKDIFRYKYMKAKESDFLIIEKNTGLISQNPYLNAGYVKDEIFDKTNLHKLGFTTDLGKLQHNYPSDEEANIILRKVGEIIRDKKVTTRINRGEIIGVLQRDRDAKKILAMKKSRFRNLTADKIKLTKRTPKKNQLLFGGEFPLKSGDVNNLYCDINELFTHFNKSSKYRNSTIFIRMGLRLLCETVFGKNDWPKEIEHEFDVAKNKLSKDEKTTLRTQEVQKNNIVELLHIGAHAYTAANNKEQTLAMSLIIGQILKKTHGKQS